MHDDYDHLRDSADAAIMERARNPEPEPERAILTDFGTRAAERASLLLAVATVPYVVTRVGDRYQFSVPKAALRRAIEVLTVDGTRTAL